MSTECCRGRRRRRKQRSGTSERTRRAIEVVGMMVGSTEIVVCVAGEVEVKLVMAGVKGQ